MVICSHESFNTVIFYKFNESFKCQNSNFKNTLLSPYLGDKQPWIKKQSQEALQWVAWRHSSQSHRGGHADEKWWAAAQSDGPPLPLPFPGSPEGLCTSEAPRHTAETHTPSQTVRALGITFHLCSHKGTVTGKPYWLRSIKLKFSLL